MKLGQGCANSGTWARGEIAEKKQATHHHHHILLARQGSIPPHLRGSAGRWTRAVYRNDQGKLAKAKFTGTGAQVFMLKPKKWKAP